MGSCLSGWLEWLSNFCGLGGGEGEDGDSIVQYVIETLKQYVSPTEDGGFMKTLLCPILTSEFYQKLAKCEKLKQLAMGIGVLGFLICLESFFSKPWLSQLQQCLCDECSCAKSMKFLIIGFYLKALIFNIMGVLTNAALVYGIHYDKPDYLSVWLMWRTVVIMAGLATVLAIWGMSVFAPSNLDAESWNEFLRVIANLVAWVIVYTYMEEGDNEGGGPIASASAVNEDDAESAEVDGFLQQQQLQHPDAVSSSAIY